MACQVPRGTRTFLFSFLLLNSFLCTFAPGKISETDIYRALLILTRVLKTEKKEQKTIFLITD